MQLLSVRLMVIAALAASCCASAQTYPNRTIHIVVGFIAGTGVDVAGRIVAQFLSEGLGQAAVVENKPGMASVLAAREVARAAPDGYSLLLLRDADRNSDRNDRTRGLQPCNAALR